MARILLVGEDAEPLGTLRRLLAAEGHHVEARAGRDRTTRPAAPGTDVAILAGVGDPGAAIRGLRPEPDAPGPRILLVTGGRGDPAAAVGLAAGADDVLPRPIDPPVLRARLGTALRIRALEQALRGAREAADAATRRDPLTGAWSRRQALEDLDQLRALAQRYRRPATIARVDVEGRGPLNEALGEASGNEVLRKVARVLADDTRAVDRVYRYAGAGFLLGFPEVRPEQAAVALERLRAGVEVLRLPQAGGGTGGVVTLRIGLAGFDPSLDASPEAWIARAEAALARARAAGGTGIGGAEREGRASDGP